MRLWGLFLMPALVAPFVIALVIPFYMCLVFLAALHTLAMGIMGIEDSCGVSHLHCLPLQGASDLLHTTLRRSVCGFLHD